MIWYFAASQLSVNLINLIDRIYVYTSIAPTEIPLAVVNTPAEIASELPLKIQMNMNINTSQFKKYIHSKHDW